MMPGSSEASSSPRSAANSRSRSLLVLRDACRRVDDDLDVEVAAAASPDLGHSPSFQADDLAGLGARRDRDRLGPVEGLDVELGAERRLGHRHVLRGDEVRSGTFEPRVGGDTDVDVEVPGRAAAHRRARRHR